MAHARGKYAKMISDRSGFAYPFSEMIQEWNGSWVHKSEFETKHPQENPKTRHVDPEALKHSRPARKEPMVVFVGGKGFFDHNDTMQPEEKTSPFVNAFIGQVTVSTS
jgi:hypothetical protein